MVKRYAHYHKSGKVTAKLELVLPEDEGVSVDFIRRHADAVREGFDGSISESADNAYERMRAVGHAYRYRPCTLRVEYATEGKRRGAVLDISVMCTSGRRMIYAAVERHRLRRAAGETVYMGKMKTREGSAK